MLDFSLADTGPNVSLTLTLLVSLEFEQVLIWLFSCDKNDEILRKGVCLILLPSSPFLAMALGA